VHVFMLVLIVLGADLVTHDFIHLSLPMMLHSSSDHAL